MASFDDSCAIRAADVILHRAALALRQDLTENSDEKVDLILGAAVVGRSTNDRFETQGLEHVPQFGAPGVEVLIPWARTASPIAIASTASCHLTVCDCWPFSAINRQNVPTVHLKSIQNASSDNSMSQPSSPWAAASRTATFGRASLTKNLAEAILPS